jgi:hypothetical protein
MATRFEELEFDGIEQGRLTDKIDAAFKDVVKKFLKHVELEKPVKAKATLTLAIDLVYGDNQVKIITDIKHKLPEKAIIGGSTAFIEHNQDDQLTLWAPVGGSNVGDPKQRVLCGDHGEPIDEQV